MSKNHKRLMAGITAVALVFSLAPAAPVSAQGEEFITFSEVMYDLVGGDQNREWVEIYNTGNEPVTINPDSWRFNDGSNHILRLVQGNLTLEPGQAAVLTANDQVFLSEHEGFAGTVVDTVINLGNERGTISLSAGNGNFTVLSYEAGWGANGNGYTLEKIDHSGDNVRENWRQSAAAGGTPGEVVVQGEPEVMEQVISLSRGWNMISSYVAPENQSIEQIFAPLIEAGLLRMVKDGQGRIYAPELNLNQIERWNPEAGYLVKVSEAAVLTIRGTARIPLIVEVLAGWNLLAYPLEESYDVREIIGHLENGQVEMVKNGSGRFYNRQFNFSNLSLLTAGQGYWVKVTENSVLNWNELE